MAESGGDGRKPVPDCIEAVVRAGYGRILSLLISQFRDIELAEDALQDAVVSALAKWPETGLPEKPEAWLVQVARRKGIDRLRRDQNFLGKAAQMRQIAEIEAQVFNSQDEDSSVDERLRLIFTCCHPALERQAQVALTLKTLCGLTTGEIASGFLVSETTMAQRIVRAKSKIKRAGIPYRVPPRQLLGERVPAVLAVIYLIFNEGYYRSGGEDLISLDLCAEALFLGQMLLRLMSGESEVVGLNALMLFHHARQPARQDDDGMLVDLEHQDRRRWRQDAIRQADTMLKSVLIRGRPGSYQIQAAVSGLHCHATRFADTDWRQMVLLYERLGHYDGNPVIGLNHAVALSFAEGPAAALHFMESIPLRETMDGYHPWHTARAAMLARVGEYDEAMHSYRTAISLCSNKAEKQYLERKLKALEAD